MHLMFVVGYRPLTLELWFKVGLTGEFYADVLIGVVSSVTLWNIMLSSICTLCNT